MSMMEEREVKLKTATDHERCDQLYLLAWDHRNKDLHKMHALTDEALKLSHALSYDKGIAYSLRNTAFIHQQKAKYDESCKYAYEALSLFEKINDQIGEASVFNTLGINYYRLGDYENAIMVHLKALQKREAGNDRPGIAASYINLGNVYSGLKDYVNTLKYYNKGLAEMIANNDALGKAAIINNIASVNLMKGDYEAAVMTFQESIVIKKEINDEHGLAVSYNNLGECFLNLGDFQKAEEYQLHALGIYHKKSNASGEGLCMLGLGKIYLKTGRFNDAVEMLNAASVIFTELNLRDDLIEVYDTLAAVFCEKGDFRKAYEHQKNLNALLREVSEEETRKKIGNMQLLHQLETVRHEAEIHRLRNVELKKLNDEVEEKNKEITDSINYAQLIQQSMLPDTRDIQRSFGEAFVFFQPRNIVSGDFYWFHRIEQHHENSPCIIVLADCTGHGVPGAFMSMIGNTVLNQLVIEKMITDPGRLLNELDEKVRTMLKQYRQDSASRDGMDIALCYYDPASFTLSYAGGNRPLLVFSEGQIKEFEPDKNSIGGFKSNEKSFTTTTIALKKGDCVYMYSDGLVDQFGGTDEAARLAGGKKFLARRFYKFLYDHSALSLADQSERITSMFNDWKGELEQTDDVCLIGLKI